MSLTIPSFLDTSHPGDVVRWAADAFGIDNLAVTASFEDAVLVHVAATAVPGKTRRPAPGEDKRAGRC